MPATSQNLKLVYEGSVKRVFESPTDSRRLWFQFSDDYSVFDWGKMPDTIANKGRALTVMGAYFFQTLAKPEFWRSLESSAEVQALDSVWRQSVFGTDVYKRLSKAGAEHHFHRLLSADAQEQDLAAAAAAANTYMEVEKAEVLRPQARSVLGQIVYKYPSDAASHSVRLVPLEVVFRFGMPAGSSLKDRLDRDPEYARQLGLQSSPVSGAFFDRPVIEFFTKLEPKDRLLGLSEALNISTLGCEQFAELAQLSLLISLALKRIFAERGIELWDGKLEFIYRNGHLCLADSIGPDELRLIYNGVQLSKETIRQVYRGTAWEKALKQSQQMAAARGTADWKSICRNELKMQPDKLPADFKQKIDQLYGVLANHLVGQELFAAQPILGDFAAGFAGVREKR